MKRHEYTFSGQAYLIDEDVPVTLTYQMSVQSTCRDLKNGIPTDHLWFRMLPVWPDWAIFGRHWWQILFLLSAAEGRAELVFTWVVVVVVLVGFLLHKITQSLYLSLTIKIIKPVQSADLYFFVFNKYFYHLLFLLLQQKVLPNNGELLTNLFRIKT